MEGQDKGLETARRSMQSTRQRAITDEEQGALAMSRSYRGIAWLAILFEPSEQARTVGKLALALWSLLEDALTLGSTRHHLFRRSRKSLRPA
jgi:hypothetical protein